MICYMFPGQGSQHVGMGCEYFERYPEILDEADHLLGYSVVDLCTKDDGRLDRTEYTQPALYTVNALAYLDAVRQGARPDFLLGHSLGEYNALHAAGAMSFGDGLRLVKRRGQLMGEAPPGAMAAVIGMTRLEVETALEEHALDAIDIANHNSLRQIVISGPEAEIAKAESVFGESAHFVPLRTSGAFHSRCMADAADAFSRSFGSVEFQAPSVRVISNVSGRPHEPGGIAESLARQVASPVRWVQSIAYLLEAGVREFEELGPGEVLTKMVSTIRRELDGGRVDPDSGRKVESDRRPGLEHRREVEFGRRRESTSRQGTVLDGADPVNRWNAAIDVGQEVVRRDDGQVFRTRSEAICLFGSKPVVYLKGFKGYFELSGLDIVRN